MTRAPALAVSALLVVFGFAADARADLISDEEAQCQSAAEGDACKIGSGAGVCAKSKCSRNDYSDGPPPKQVTSDCLVCAPKPSADTKSMPEPTVSSTETKTAADTKTPSGESKPATTSKSGCASGDADAGPWLLGSIVLGLGLVGLGRRRANGQS